MVSSFKRNIVWQWFSEIYSQCIRVLYFYYIPKEEIQKTYAEDSATLLKVMPDAADGGVEILR